MLLFCGRPNSSNVTLLGTASFAFMYNPPHSASAAVCMTDLIIFADISIAPLDNFPSNIRMPYFLILLPLGRLHHSLLLESFHWLDI